jgi:hypothetical protein
LLNREFSFALGGVYALLAFTLTSLPRWDVTLIEFLALFGIFVSYTGYQEKFSSRVIALSTAHAFVHFAAMIGLSFLVVWLGDLIWPLVQWNWLAWGAFVAAITVPGGGFIAGTIFGLNLLVTCLCFGINHNDAFSSMRLDSHRHFLRIRILGNTLHVYPVSLERVPRRDEWKENPLRRTHPSASVFIPPDTIFPHLIEGPIVIRAQHAPSTSEVKSPSELPTPKT